LIDPGPVGDGTIRYWLLSAANDKKDQVCWNTDVLDRFPRLLDKKNERISVDETVVSDYISGILDATGHAPGNEDG
jgi:hypothetical protein